jgi:hypothetical protein
MTYEFPSFLAGAVTPEAYSRWLARKAAAHVKRDRKRGNRKATVALYKQAIHRAVVDSQGRDAYTDEQLNWSLISQYNNAKAKSGGRKYKHAFALLPTVDHKDDGLGAPDVTISGWRTNDAKHDLSLNEFLVLCTAVLQHHGRKVTPG